MLYQQNIAKIEKVKTIYIHLSEPLFLEGVRKEMFW